jgi:segregation and condensation protein A
LQEALTHLSRVMGELPSWAVLQRFLPDGTALDTVERKAALASTLLAGLEMARGGALELRQERAFGPIMLRRAKGVEENKDVRAA